MRVLQSSITGLMVVVLVAAISIGALRHPSETWAGVMYLVTCGILLLSVVGATVLSAGKRAWWLGFALFGWGYMVLVFEPRAISSLRPSLPTSILLRAVGTRLYPERTSLIVPSRRSAEESSPIGHSLKSLTRLDTDRSARSLMAILISAFQLTGPLQTETPYAGPQDAPDVPFLQIGHCLFALGAAVIGGLLATILFGIAPRSGAHSQLAPGSTRAQGELEVGLTDQRRHRRRCWIICLVGLCANLTFALLAICFQSTTFEGATFLLTCALLGIAALGAVRETGHQRNHWFGGALFGWGYLLLAFNSNVIQNGWPYLKESEPPRLFTTSELDTIRHRTPPFPRLSPPLADGSPVDNVPVFKALERRLSVRFAETGLQTALDELKTQTKSPELPNGLHFYVDRGALERVMKALDSPVSLESDGVPLKMSLRLLLNQLELDYVVKSGIVLVTSRRDILALAVYYDPVQRVGHCLIAVMAACVGAMAARWAFTEPETSIRR
jgi:hypothetical protein